MNFLAHLYLSGDDDGLLIGNFIADGIRGKEMDTYPEFIKKGIVLHRKIDTYTDTHPIVKQTVARLRNSSGKYAPVVSDIVFDHFLAVHWKDYSKMGLEEYISEKYHFLRRNRKYIPENMQLLLDSMVKQNWLLRYADLDGIAKTLRSMSRRVHFANTIPLAIKDLENNYKEFDQDFTLFFPELERYVKEERSKEKLLSTT